MSDTLLGLTAAWPCLDLSTPAGVPWSRGLAPLELAQRGSSSRQVDQQPGVTDDTQPGGTSSTLRPQQEAFLGYSSMLRPSYRQLC